MERIELSFDQGQRLLTLAGGSSEPDVHPLIARALEALKGGSEVVIIIRQGDVERREEGGRA